jgi:hypothetical protein
MAIRVHVKPTGLHSRAMVRVANALERYAPSHVTIARSPNDADLIVLHVIGSDAIDYARSFEHTGQRYAVIQYCYRTAAPLGVNAPWLNLWQSADLVWSYYDLSTVAECAGFNFYHAPLGLDDVFATAPAQPHLGRARVIVTTGYVSGSGPGAEPIEDVWIAAKCAGVGIIHIGPANVVGMRLDVTREVHTDISDTLLAEIYGRATWVSALRRTEGFELPGIEGLSCGARPIVFDNADNRHWYGDGDYANYVKDRGGIDLVDDLLKIFTRRVPSLVSRSEPSAISNEDLARVRNKFNWRTICEGFYGALDNREECIA